LRERGHCCVSRDGFDRILRRNRSGTKRRVRFCGELVASLLRLNPCQCVALCREGSPAVVSPIASTPLNRNGRHQSSHRSRERFGLCQRAEIANQSCLLIGTRCVDLVAQRATRSYHVWHRYDGSRITVHVTSSRGGSAGAPDGRGYCGLRYLSRAEVPLIGGHILASHSRRTASVVALRRRSRGQPAPRALEPTSRNSSWCLTFVIGGLPGSRTTARGSPGAPPARGFLCASAQSPMPGMPAAVRTIEAANPVIARSSYRFRFYDAGRERTGQTEQQNSSQASKHSELPAFTLHMAPRSGPSRSRWN
jgi:hypothetical protein